MKPPIPYAGAPRPRLVPIVRKPQGDLVLSTVSEPKRSAIPSYSGEAVRPAPVRPRLTSAEEVKRVVLAGWRDGLLLREIAEQTGISLKRVHWGSHAADASMKTLVSKLGEQPALFESFRKRNDAEFRLQCAIVHMLRWLAYPGWFYAHIPNGEYRTEATGKRLKAMGVVPGMFDLLLISPSGEHMWLELKVDVGKLSPAQLEFEGMLCRCGIKHAVVWGFGDAERQLRDWEVLRPEARMR